MSSDNKATRALANAVRTIDGDTFERNGESLRLRNIDTAEVQHRESDPPELPAATRATEITDEFVNRPGVEFPRDGVGRHGRPLVTPVDPSTGEDLERELVRSGLALTPSYNSRDFSGDDFIGAARDPSGLESQFDPRGLGSEAHAMAFENALTEPSGRQRDPRGQFNRGLATGIDETKALLGGLTAWAGDVMENESWVESGMERYRDNMAASREHNLNVERIQEIEGFGDFRDWAASWMGRALPSLATAVGGAGVGGVAANVTARSVARQQINKQISGRFAQRAVAGKIGTRSYEQYMAHPGIQRAIKNRVQAGALGATKYGGMAGSTLGAGGPATGAVYGDLYERGIRAPLTSALAGGAVGALNTLALGNALKMFLGPGTSPATVDGVRNLMGAYGASMLRRGLEQGAVEGVTEGLQDLTHAAAVAYEDPDMDFFTKDTFDNMLNAMAVGALMGSVTGGTAGATQAVRTTRVVEPEAKAAEPVAREQEQLALPAPAEPTAREQEQAAPPVGVPTASQDAVSREPKVPETFVGDENLAADLLAAADEAEAAGDHARAEDLRYIAARTVMEDHQRRAELARGTNDKLAATHDGIVADIKQRLDSGLYGRREGEGRPGGFDSRSRAAPTTTRRLTEGQRVEAQSVMQALAAKGLTDMNDPAAARQVEQSDRLSGMVADLLGLERRARVGNASVDRLPNISVENMLQLSELSQLPPYGSSGRAKPSAAEVKRPSTSEVAAKALATRVRDARKKLPKIARTKEQRDGDTRLGKKRAAATFSKGKAAARTVAPAKKPTKKSAAHKRPAPVVNPVERAKLKLLESTDVSKIGNKRQRLAVILSKLDADFELNKNEQRVLAKDFGEYFRGHLDYKDPAAVTRGMSVLLERHGREAILAAHRKGGDLVGLVDKHADTHGVPEPTRVTDIMEKERKAQNAEIKALISGIPSSPGRRVAEGVERGNREARRLFHEATTKGSDLVGSRMDDDGDGDRSFVNEDGDIQEQGLLTEAQAAYDKRVAETRAEIEAAFGIAVANGKQANPTAQVTLETQKGTKTVLDFPSLAAIGQARLQFDGESTAGMTHERRILLQLQEAFRTLGDSDWFSPPFKNTDQVLFDHMREGVADPEGGKQVLRAAGPSVVVETKADDLGGLLEKPVRVSKKPVAKPAPKGTSIRDLVKAQLRGDGKLYRRRMLRDYMQLVAKGKHTAEEKAVLNFYQEEFQGERAVAWEILAELKKEGRLEGVTNPESQVFAQLLEYVTRAEESVKALEDAARDDVVNAPGAEYDNTAVIDHGVIESLSADEELLYLQALEMNRLDNGNIDNPVFQQHEKYRDDFRGMPDKNLDGSSKLQKRLHTDGLSKGERRRGFTREVQGARQPGPRPSKQGWRKAGKASTKMVLDSNTLKNLQRITDASAVGGVRILTGNLNAKAVGDLPPAFVAKVAQAQANGQQAVIHTMPGQPIFAWVAADHGLSGKRSYYKANGQLNSAGQKRAAEIRDRALDGVAAEYAAEKAGASLLEDPRLSGNPEVAVERQSRLAAEHKAKPHLDLDLREYAVRQMVRGFRDLRQVPKDSPVRDVVKEIRKVWQAARAEKAAVPPKFSDFLRGVSSELAAREYGPLGSQEVAAGPRTAFGARRPGTSMVTTPATTAPGTSVRAKRLRAKHAEAPEPSGKVAEQLGDYQAASDKIQGKKTKPPKNPPAPPAAFDADQLGLTLPGLIQKKLVRAIKTANGKVPESVKDLFMAVFRPAEKVFRAVFNEIKTRPGATASLKAIGDLFGPGGGFYETKNALSAAVWEKYSAAFKGWGNDRKVAAMKDRIAGRDTADAKVWGQFFDDLFTTLVASTDNPQAMAREMGYVENYIPRLWDVTALESNRAGAIKMLMGAKDAKGNKVFATEAEAGSWVGGIISADGFEMTAAEGVGHAGNATHNARLLARMFAGNPDGIDQFLDLNPDTVMYRYAESYGRTGAEARYLGGNMGVVDQQTGEIKQVWRRNGKLHSAIDDSQANGMSQADGDRIKGTIYNALMGRAGAGVNRRLKVAVGRIQLYQNMRTLLFSTLSSFVDISGIGIRTGNMNDTLYAVQQLSNKASRAELREMAETLGIVGDVATQRILDQMYQEGMGQDATTKKWGERFFKAVGQTQWTNMSRLVAVAAGRRFLSRVANDPNHPIHREALKELGAGEYSPDQIIAAIKSFGDSNLDSNFIDLKGDQKIYADVMSRFVNSAIMMPQAGQRPAWASHPALALIFHLKSFMYSFHHTVLMRGVKNIGLLANERGVGAAAAYSAANAGLLMGLASFGLAIRNALQYRIWDEEPPEHRQFGFDWAYMVELLDRSGGAGIAQLVVDGGKASERGQFALMSPLGPTINQVESFIGASEETDGWFDGKLGHGKSNEFFKAIPVLSQITPLRRRVMGALGD